MKPISSVSITSRQAASSMRLTKGWGDAGAAGEDHHADPAEARHRLVHRHRHAAGLGDVAAQSDGLAVRQVGHHGLRAAASPER